MGRIMDRVLQFFDENDWGYEVSPDGIAIDAGVELDGGTFDVVVFADDAAEVLGVVMVVTYWTPEERRGAVCEYLARDNWPLFSGCFHMDLRDGGVQYRTFIDLEGGELSVAMVRNAVLEACEAVARSYPGLMAVTWDGLSPAEATGQANIGEEPRVAMVQ